MHWSKYKLAQFLFQSNSIGRHHDRVVGTPYANGYKKPLEQSQCRQPTFRFDLKTRAWLAFASLPSLSVQLDQPFAAGNDTLQNEQETETA
jgi:hypothetical protein